MYVADRLVCHEELLILEEKNIKKIKKKIK